jgi:hypothetical protein
MKSRIAVFACVIIVSMSAGKTNAQIYSGIDLQRQCGGRVWGDYNSVQNPNSCYNFYRRTIQEILVEPHAGICFPPNYSVDGDWSQTVSVVQNFMHYNPRALARPATAIVSMALHGAYHCR